MATVKSILDKKGRFVATVSPDDSVLDAAHVMNDQKIGAVVVVEGRRVAGIFTERDILTRVVAEQRDPAGTPISDVMTAAVACCKPATTLEECRGVMTERRIRHLPVVENGMLLGIVASGDIMTQEAMMRQETIEFLNQYVYDYK